MIILKIVVIILMADLLTGFFHFLLDQYGKPDARFFKNAIKINLAHHENPRLMVDRTYWQLTKDSYYIGIALFAISLLWGFHWEIALLLIVGAQANILHKWAHMKRSEKSILIHFLQKIKVLQNKRHHGNHHRKPFDSYFCVMTNFWNPILERIYFWEGMVRLLRIFGLEPVAGTSIRNNV
ncbi:fatty acid desaturase family protein [Portibacter lacus]|nr:fatty acid desaturase family protein [Portibacter lacus]